jgi:hypothetical protein
VVGKIDVPKTGPKISFMDKFRQVSGTSDIYFSVFIYTIFVSVIALIVYGFVSFYSAFEDCKKKENTLGPKEPCDASIPCFYETTLKRSCDSCSLGHMLNANHSGHVCRSSEQHIDALAVTECFPETDGARQYRLTINVLDSGSNPLTAAELTVKIADTEFINGDGNVSSKDLLNGFDLFDYINKDVKTFIKRCAFTVNIKLPVGTTKHIASVTQTGMRSMSSSLQENDTVPPREVTVVSAPKDDTGTLTISLAPSTISS